MRYVQSFQYKDTRTSCFEQVSAETSRATVISTSGVKVFKNGLSKICERQHLKNLKIFNESFGANKNMMELLYFQS